jgi:hypothetical protein
MTDATDDSLSTMDCCVLEEHGQARVVIKRSMVKFFESLDVRCQARLKSVMKLWCEGRKLTPEMFNPNEGRTPKHNVMLQAFKRNQIKLRLYGFCSTIGGKKTFVILDSDPSKKQNKADPIILKRAKAHVDHLVETLKSEGNLNG